MFLTARSQGKDIHQEEEEDGYDLRPEYPLININGHWAIRYCGLLTFFGAAKNKKNADILIAYNQRKFKSLFQIPK
jgi:hypothetical protein